MCGIVGYIGQKEMDGTLIGALSRLEYRGYDSAGIAALDLEGIKFAKRSGKLNLLKEAVSKEPVGGHIGIGHTRWATHGEPSEKNAHPHLSDSNDIAVVHNGIIENYEDLKEKLQEKGYVFKSDTDSEVITHLVSYYHLEEKKGLEDAVRTTVNDLEGSFAFCVISKTENDKFVAARNGSPLVVGLGDGENFVASDAPALLDHTRDVIFLDDYQMVVVKKDEVKVTTTKGEPVQSKVTRIDWDAKDVSKEGFDHYMLKEIEEQSKVFERIVRTRINEGLENNLFDIVRFDVEKLNSVKRILIQSCGTSWHAGLTAKYWFENIAGIPTEVDVSSEFRYRNIIQDEDTLVLSITQSGETIDALMGMRQGKKSGLKALSICNVLGSTISRESDAVIFTHAGPEIGVASTKAYTAQLAVLFLLSLYWGKVKENISTDEYDRYVEEFKLIPEKIKNITDKRGEMQSIAKKYAEARDFLFLGRGVNYPNAHEGALKIKEIAYIHATGHPAGEMKHGPIALIDEHLPVVSIVPKSSVYEKMVSNVQEVKARSGKVIAIATEGDDHIHLHCDDLFMIPATDEMLTPMLVAIPLQYIAYYVAVLKGTDVDQPRNLAKSVTVE